MNLLGVAGLCQLALTRQQRSEIARAAVNARWANARKAKNGKPWGPALSKCGARKPAPGGVAVVAIEQRY
jgi:hypothetical protein